MVYGWIKSECMHRIVFLRAIVLKAPAMHEIIERYYTCYLDLYHFTWLRYTAVQVIYSILYCLWNVLYKVYIVYMPDYEDERPDMNF